MSDDTPTQRFDAAGDVPTERFDAAADAPTQRLDPGAPPAEATEERKSRRLLVILAIIGGVLLLAVLIVLILLLTRGNPNPGALPSGSPSASASRPSPSATPTISASPSPSPTPTQTQTAPPPPPPDTSAKFTDFSHPDALTCNNQAPSIPAYVPAINFSWASKNAVSAWFVNGTSDAADSKFMQIPLSGNQDDIKALGDDVHMDCHAPETYYTITLVDSNGKHTSKTATIKNNGDISP
ncbi:hypothetical protein BH11ACT4_BH11ACT4_10760 [soil metagenome]